jgi:hypothetical protein
VLLILACGPSHADQYVCTVHKGYTCDRKTGDLIAQNAGGLQFTVDTVSGIVQGEGIPRGNYRVIFSGNKVDGAKLTYRHLNNLGVLYLQTFRDVPPPWVKDRPAVDDSPGPLRVIPFLYVDATLRWSGMCEFAQ